MKNLRIRLFPLLMAVMLIVGCKNNTESKTGSVDPIFKNDPNLKSITEQIADAPKDPTLYFKRGAMLHRMGIDTLAIKDYKMAATLDSTKSEYYSAVGDLLFESKDIAGSVQWLQKAIARNPTDRKAHLKIAKLFLYIREYEKGMAEINIVLRKDVYDPEAYFLKGMIYKDMKDTARAISTFQTAVQVDPQYRDAVIQLGLLFSAKKDPLAIKYFDNALRIDSNDVLPLYAKGVFFQENKDYVNAKAAYKECIVRNSHYVDAYFNMGYVYMQEDSFAKAYRQYDLATKIDPTNPTAYYNRGICSELMDSVRKAVFDYKQASLLDPNYKSPQDALKRLGIRN